MNSIRRKEYAHRVSHELRSSKEGGLSLVLAAVFAAVLLYVSASPIGESSDRALMHLLYAIRGPEPAPSSVVIASIDDHTYEQFEVSPRLPFPREITADIITKVHGAQPKVLMIDATAPAEEDPVGSKLLADAIKLGPTVIGKGKRLNEVLPADSPEMKYHRPLVDPEVTDSAALAVLYELRFENKTAYHLSLESNPSLHIEQRIPFWKPLTVFYGMPSRQPDPQDAIRFYGPPGTVETIPASEILQSDASTLEQLFRDKAVFLGFQSIGRRRGAIDKEQFRIPYGSHAMFGLEIHATLFANLLEESWYDVVHESSVIPLTYWVSFFLALAGFITHEIQRSLLRVGLLLLAYNLTVVISFLWFDLFIGAGLVINAGTLFVLLPVAVYQAHMENHARKQHEEVMGAPVRKEAFKDRSL